MHYHHVDLYNLFLGASASSSRYRVWGFPRKADRMGLDGGAFLCMRLLQSLNRLHQDSMWAAVYSTAPATVILKCGSSSGSFSVTAGVSKLKIPLAAGQMTVQMIRNGQTIINYTPTGYTYVLNPVLCAFILQIIPRSYLTSFNRQL